MPEPSHPSDKSLRRFPRGSGVARSNRHDRLWNFAKILREIETAAAENPKEAEALFARARKSFFAEGWESRHFQSFESKELLMRLNGYFQTHNLRPGRKPAVSSHAPSLENRSRKASVTAQTLLAQRSFLLQERARGKKIEVALLVLMVIFLAILLFLLT